ncbi:DUF2617 family protein [Thermomonospora umbrina]|uniref:Uncharacterized protein DUF2617 n=1 Tax=Thermomonospora umbrina TaxID=111806 RepID=A0A3D9SPV2_9ACTN|nr:DUF2617 family protein [Thermomonospora umbrina]REE95993.1 uncharacterized protein DUF2617 [Thermomonospora umbrina]
MRAALDTPYLDTRADALTFALGLAPLDALAVLPVERDGLRVEMRLLGASHQVFVGPVSETVACLPGEPGPLPEGLRAEVAGWSYDFRADVRSHGTEAGFAAAVRELCARLAHRDDALTGTFPGSPHAVTALALEDTPGGRMLGWRTWHAYPQTREIVVTRTLLEVAQ